MKSGTTAAKKRYSVSLKGEKTTNKFCATEQKKEHCKTIKRGTAVQYLKKRQYPKKRNPVSLGGDNKVLENS